MTMDQDFLGVGWNFPVTADGGRIAMARYEERVRQSIRLILETARGERVMRPEFGCGVHDLVFSAGDTTTAGLVALEVRRSLIRWEPRIDTLNVSAAPDPEHPERLLVSIDYRLRATNNRFNLTWPFYLEY